MSIRPLGDRVLVKLSEAEAVSKGGILIPHVAQEKSHEGIVVNAGPGRVTESGQFVEIKVRKGDRVMLPKYLGTEITVEGAPHVILSEGDLIGIIE